MSGELTIVGIGMIGASFALAARDLFDRISALDPDDDHLEQALAAGIIDERVDAVPARATAVLLACPSDRIAHWVVALADHSATVFDAGSIKGAILDAVTAERGAVPGNFVPSHPIAGLEQSGPMVADRHLFAGRTVIVTPLAGTDTERLASVQRWWQATGARLMEMDPAAHDQIYARTSHLPHLLAFSYLLGISDEDLAHTGGGFKDFSRIGGSDPDMWTGIFAGNRAALMDALSRFDAHLAEFRSALETDDLERCRALIAAARARREKLS